MRCEGVAVGGLKVVALVSPGGSWKVESSEREG